MISPPCVCIFTGYYYPHYGGVEKYTSGLSKFLNLNGYRVVIITTNTEDVEERETIGNIEILRLPVLSLFKKRYPVPDFFSAGYRQILETIRNEKVDYFIINTRFYLTTFIGLRIAAGRNKKCMLIEHGTGHLVTKNPVVDFFAARYEHFLTALVKRYHPVFYGVSEACSKWLQHFGLTAEGVIYNGIDTGIDRGNAPVFRQQFSIPGDQVIFSSASRLIPEKGVSELVTAFVSFSEGHAGAHLFLAGEGPLLGSFKQRFAGHRQIHILGKLPYPDVLNLFGESDVVVVPSRYPEGLPTVILEAGLAGCAVISTDVGGAREVISSGETGLLIENCQEGNLFEAMNKLYHDEELRKNMATNLHDRVLRQFDWGPITKQLLSETFFCNPGGSKYPESSKNGS